MKTTKELLTPERRAHLTGDTVREIQRLCGIVSSGPVMHPQEYDENVKALERANEKLRYLQEEELRYLQKRLDVLNKDYAQCEPGHMTDLHALILEVESKINRLHKQLHPS